MADTNTTCNVMLFEAGALAADLGGNTQCQALARKIEDAYSDALVAGELAFDLVLSPFEVGMAFGAASNGSGLLSQAVAGKLQEALRAKLDELGVNYGGTHPQQGGLGGDEGSEQPGGEPQPTDADGTTYSNPDEQQDAL